MQECKVLFLEDCLDDARLVQEMLAEAANSLFRVHTADCLVAALNALAQRRFDVALVDLGLADSHGLETLLTIQRHAPGLPIVALTGLDSESTALAAVERGAQDCLVKGKLTAEALARALQYATLRRHNASGPAQAPMATVVGVLGAKGGVGATTIACHWALELRRQTQKKVLLVDLDVSSASASFLMDVHSEYTAAEASMNLHRLDASFWNSLVCGTSHGVDVLQAPGAMRFHEPLNGERVRHVLRFTRALYGYIVVDLGRLNEVSLNLTEEVSELFVVTTPEIPSLYEAGRVLSKLLEPGITGGRIQLILNRLAKGVTRSTSDLECVLGRPVCATLGDYSSELHEAYGNGQFLDERLPLSKQTRQMVAGFLGIAEEPKAPARTGLGLFRFAGAGQFPHW
ncbi:MAG: response regulator [Bryobacteraceae bacterium]|jgi:Flp pilus assembly CpaE family ATPase